MSEKDLRFGVQKLGKDGAQESIEASRAVGALCVGGFAMVSWCSARRVETGLERLAGDLGSSKPEGPTTAEQLFAMYVVPVEDLMLMTEIKAHEDLLQEGALVEFDDSKGNAMFVSHQWAGVDHPDPELAQFRVLQQALKNAMKGASVISGNINLELYNGHQVVISAKDLSSKPLFVWYDYFSCPQSHARATDRQLAISSIPLYVDRCHFFAILCPHVYHAQQGCLLNRQGSRVRYHEH